jgi:hypothetical protein
MTENPLVSTMLGAGSQVVGLTQTASVIYSENEYNHCPL